jgi:hypothetical protein
MCTNILPILKFAGVARSRFYKGCNANQTIALEITVANITSLATAAYNAVETAAYTFNFWFKSNSADVKDIVCAVYADIINSMQNEAISGASRAKSLTLRQTR